MEIRDVIRPECIRTGMQFSGKEEALQAVAEAAKASPVVYDVKQKDIFKALKEREKVRSTGMEGGVAIPHCRLKNVSDFVVGGICVPDGVEFEALDGNPVKFLVFIIAPEDQANAHLRLLSGISRTLSALRTEEVASMSEPEEVMNAFLEKAPGLAPQEETSSRNMLQVYVQDEEMFEQILEVFAGFEGCSFVVDEVKSASQYLTRIPLFATFAGDFRDEFCQRITAVVDRRLSNEVIRAVDETVGGLQSQEGVMLFVQELPYCAGGLAP